MKTIKYLLMAIVIGTISGCSHYYVLTPSYTDIGKITILSLGKTIEQTNQILATSPHEIAYISPSIAKPRARKNCKQLPIGGYKSRPNHYQHHQRY